MEELEEDKVVRAPKPLETDEDGNPVGWDYATLTKEAEKRRKAAAFKTKIKSISFSRVPGGGRD